MKYRVIDTIGHCFELGEIIKPTGVIEYGLKEYVNKENCLQLLEPWQIQYVPEIVNINIKVL